MIALIPLQAFALIASASYGATERKGPFEDRPPHKGYPGVVVTARKDLTGK